jgi:hypothetical protein
VTPGKRNERPVDPARPREWHQLGQQFSAQVAVVHRYGGVRQLTHEHRPQIGAISSPGAEVANGGSVPAGSRQVARPSTESGRHRMGVYGSTGPVLDCFCREGQQLVRDGSCPDQLQPLGHAHVLGIGLAQPLPDQRGLVDPRRSVDEASA